MGPEASINVTSSQVKVKEKDQVARQIISKRLSGRVKLRTKSVNKSNSKSISNVKQANKQLIALHEVTHAS